MDKLEKEMVTTLNQQKLKENWVQKLTLTEKKIMPASLLRDNILFIQKGMLHIEIEVDKTSHIFAFLQSDDIVYPSYFNDSSRQMRVVIDSYTEVIAFNQEFFLNYATMKPIYMEWLSDKLDKNLSKFLYESTKPRRQDNILTNLEYVNKVIQDELQQPNIEIFDLFSKRKLASYCHLSRSTFNSEIKNLQENNLIAE
ncbi:Crp/Fnr family transcriptional regulator [Listeria booriae]|uniref:Crp/Fnr family transcriptional regulator n=1 Tax=Listeria booriae TaxID=1552123 RepID=A0A842CN41_9LIST|nr:Crp/Fnr family transcriptional regulator [Listeria booriae]MBC2002169.1 Crp/Fnr family transcriptional regulator [Listeria booriae]